MSTCHSLLLGKKLSLDVCLWYVLSNLLQTAWEGYPKLWSVVVKYQNQELDRHWMPDCPNPAKDPCGFGRCPWWVVPADPHLWWGRFQTIPIGHCCEEAPWLYPKPSGFSPFNDGPAKEDNESFMFHKGHIFTMEGTYTKYLLDSLGRKPITLFFRGKPLVLGGSSSVTAAIKKRLLARTPLNPIILGWFPSTETLTF